MRSFGALRADCKVKSGKWQVASFGAKPIVNKVVAMRSLAVLPLAGGRGTTFYLI